MTVVMGITVLCMDDVCASRNSLFTVDIMDSYYREARMQEGNEEQEEMKGRMQNSSTFLALFHYQQ